jgi:hypothetical protein
MAAVAEVGLEVTVDAFATESNRRARRFWVRGARQRGGGCDVGEGLGEEQVPRLWALAQGGGLRLSADRADPSCNAEGDG